MKTAFRENLKWILPVLLAASFVFSNSLSGEFVYDDKRQILRNPLIQNPQLYSKALVSDVWAFKGDGELVASNYWRPTFTGWSILNYLLFGTDAFGWHLLNVFLHLAVCLLCFQFLIRLGAGSVPAFVISLLFAVHPVHTESVTWIAGSPDLLFSFFFLLSLLFILRFRENGKPTDFWAGVAAFLPALGAKEIGLLVIPVYYLLLQNEKKKSETKGVTGAFGPFVAAGVLYFFARWIVLGRISEAAPGAAGIASAFYTAPSVFLFYLRQTILPIVLGPNYSIRPVESFSGIFIATFLVSAAILVLLLYLAKRSRFQTVGFALFVLPLIPALNITAFSPEQIVHDRYLYLPVLGLMMLVLPEFGKLLKRITGDHWTTAAVPIAIVAAILLGIQTFRYNKVWHDEVSLWRHSVVVDPNSSFNFLQLGAVLSENNAHDESLDAYNRSLDIAPSPLAYLGRARNFLAKGKYEEAVWDLKTASELPALQHDAYSLYQTYEALAVAYERQKKFGEAARVLTKARERLPNYRAAFTGALGVVLYQQGKKEDALKELESVRTQAAREMLPESKSVLFRLGMLYSELGRKSESNAVLEEYLATTNGMNDKQTIDFRKSASETIQRSP